MSERKREKERKREEAGDERARIEGGTREL